jgi:hypothetical protein
MVRCWYAQVGWSDLGIVGRIEGTLFMGAPDIGKLGMTSTGSAVKAD